VIHLGSALNLRRIVCFSFRPLPLLRQGMLCCAFHRRETFSARPSHLKLEGPRVDSGMREAERCTDVTNAVFGEADGAVVLAEQALPFMRVGRGDRQVRLDRGRGNCEESQSIGAGYSDLG
jgi:hypothetical protein